MAGKFDSGAAWNSATRMLKANTNVVAVIAGVFFFLPNLAISLVAPELADPLAGAAPAETSEQAMAQLSELGPGFFATMIILGLIQAIGVLALLRLLTDRDKPTVGEALKSGLGGLVPYILSQIAQALIAVLAIGIPLGLVIATGSPALIAIGALLAIFAFVFLFVRFSLLSAAIAIDRIHGPVAALKRSWQLTAGKVGRLALFYFLLMIAILVVFLVGSMVFGLVFALMGEEIAMVGQALIGAAINALFVTIFLGVVAAVHRQLSSGAPEKPN